MLDPPSPMLSCSITASTCWESEGSAQWGSLTSLDAAPPSSQGSCYRAPPPFLLPCATQGDMWLLSWLAEHGHWSDQFLSGLLCGGHLFCRHFCRGQLFGGLLHFLWSGGLPILVSGYPLTPWWWGLPGSPLEWVPRFILLGTSPEGLHPSGWHHQWRPHTVPSPTSILEHTPPKCVVSPVLVD